jgi:Protein of unknown function (DUF1638)
LPVKRPFNTSGWLECAKRRGGQGQFWGAAALPANSGPNFKAKYDEWVAKFGEEQAKYLLEEMSRWTNAYTHGTLIDFDFARELGLRQQVQQVCNDKGWQYDEIPGDLRLFEKLLARDWPQAEFLVLKPGQKVVATFDDHVIGAA